MRTPQKKLVALLLLWAAVIIFQAVWVAEPWRLASAEQQALDTRVRRGAQLYAENCVICHGPFGEGVVGPPVNRPEWREDLTQLEQEQVQQMLTSVIARGRGGTDSTTWTFHTEMGEPVITSYTRMPTWGSEDGGPLNEQQVDDLVTFLMRYEWPRQGENLVTPHIRPPRLTKTVQRTGTDPQTGRETNVNEEVPIEFTDLPEAQGVSSAVNDRGRQLMLQSGCLQCHTLGNYGGFYGPNLTAVGDWTEPEFLRGWLEDPAATVPRMPTVWMGNNVPKTVPEDFEVDWDGIHQTVMPSAISLGVPEEELDVLVEYLSGLTSGS